jgi:hypothetical protein
MNLLYKNIPKNQYTLFLKISGVQKSASLIPGAITIPNEQV